MRTTGRWIGYCGPGFRKKLVETVLTLDPHATLTISPTAIDLRDDVIQTPGTHVVIGCTEDGVSEVNLAAAIVADGAAADVTLVVSQASGSLKSRALTAGVSDVIDLSQFNFAEPARYGRPVGVEDVHRTPRRAASLGEYGADEPWGSVRGSPSGGRLSGGSDELTSVLGVGGSDEMTSVLGAQPRGVHVFPVESSAIHRPEYDEPPFSEDEEPDQEDEAETPIERGAAPILAFVSGRGGVGKTVMAATAACVAASWGLRVGLCDLDYSCGNLYACFGLPRPADLSALADGRGNDVERIDRMGVSCGEGVRLWGSCMRPEMAEVLWSHTREVLCAISQTNDLVIVDTSSTFTDAVAQAAQLCDRLLITIDGRPGSTVAQSRLGALAVRLGVARTRIARVVNRCDPKGRDETIINRADVGLETARSHRVLEGGDSVSDFVAAGQLSSLVEEPSPFVQSLSTCLAQLLSEMGALPDSDAARAALEVHRVRRRRLFGRKREAV